MNNKELNKIIIITITITTTIIINIITIIIIITVLILFNYTTLTAPVSTQNLLKIIFRKPGFQVL